MRARCFKSATVPLSIAAIDKMYCLQFSNQNSERLWLNFHAKGFAAITALSCIYSPVFMVPDGACIHLLLPVAHGDAFPSPPVGQRHPHSGIHGRDE